MFRCLAAIASGLVLGACTVVGVRAGTEEPGFTVIARIGEAVEIREYAPRLAAETVVEGPEEQARGTGFRRLAAYIFGENRPGGTRIAMTAPVAQAPAAATRIAMTAPVAQAPEGAGAWRIRFFMPASWTAETLPAPVDPAVRIVTVPGETMAVLRYGGRPTPGVVAEQRMALLAALSGSPLRAAGEVEDWFFDPPWTVPALRRNEAAVRVERTAAGSGR